MRHKMSYLFSGALCNQSQFALIHFWQPSANSANG